MRRRFLYGLGVVLLILSATFVIWEGSFTFGYYAPTSPEQTLLYWAVSTLVFLLTLVVGFILFRTGIKLYYERRSNREGSRIRTKLVIGALALSFVPVFFLVLWSVSVLNFNLARWFSRPTDGVQQNLVEILDILQKEAHDEAVSDAGWLAGLEETRQALVSGSGSLEEFCQERDVRAATLVGLDGVSARALCGTGAGGGPSVRAPVAAGGKTLGYVVVPVRQRDDIVSRQASIKKYVKEYDRISIDRRGFRNFYLMLLAAICLFVLYIATWLALFLAKQISNPISALLEAAERVRAGDLGYRVRVKALDELATLVRAFNEMTYELESNSRELEMRRRFTEAILESIPTGVISIASDGRILRVNRASRQLFSEEKAAAAARLEDLFSRDDTSELKYMMKRARRTGATQRQMEMPGPRGTRQLAVTVAALEEKVTSGFVIVLEDTSDLLHMQRLAAWHEVARRIAHEIKNPLTPIALCSDRIARQIERLEIPAESMRILRECTDTIGAEVESVKTLVNEFSQFARFPAANPAPCDVNEVVESALAVFAGRLDGIEIHKDLAPGLPLVNGDREHLKRAVVNLVDNAAESMQDSLLKHLWVTTQASGAETIELTVADTGCGISAEDKDRLFLPYFSTKRRGTGLGLAIVSHILSEHNGTIRVEDNTPQGARFLVEIPAIVTGEAESRAAEARMKPPRILVVDDEPGIRQSLSGVLQDEGYQTHAVESSEACLAELARELYDLVLLDVWLPGMDGLEALARIQEMPFPDRPVVVMVSGHGTIETAVKSTKLGAFDFLEKPLTIPKVSITVKNAIGHRRLQLENERLKDDGGEKYRIIGESVPMKALRQQLGLMAGTNGRVLIYGESGTGKELAAHAIHATSKRAAEPFVEVNCAAIPEELIESELFGHRKGSFTGATGDKVGKFQKADGGSLFLDEVGDMSLKTQAKVLRALEEQRFEPVGANEFVQVDVRVIAATNKHLEEEIESGNFREDLFYRLNVIPFYMPALRERSEDIPLLAGYFLNEFTSAYGRKPKELTPEAYALLQEYHWPGNVRELKNLMERIVIMNPQVRVDARHIPLNMARRASADRGSSGFASLQEVRESAEREYILKKLDETHGNVSRTAELLGLERSNLYRKMKALGIALKEGA